jgi:hypothetical protein
MHPPAITIAFLRGVAMFLSPQLVFVNTNIYLVVASLTFPSSDSLLTTVTHAVNQIELHFFGSAMREDVHVYAHLPLRGNPPSMVAVNPHPFGLCDPGSCDELCGLSAADHAIVSRNP